MTFDAHRTVGIQRRENLVERFAVGEEGVEPNLGQFRIGDDDPAVERARKLLRDALKRLVQEAETAAARYGRILLAAERMLAERPRKPVVPDHLVGRHDHLLAASLAFNLEADTALDQRNLDQRIAPIGPQVELRTENPDVDLSGRNHKGMIRIAGHVGIELAVDEDLALRALKARRIGDARSGIEPEHRTVRKGQLLPLGITFDGVDERLATFIRRNPQSGEAEFLRLRLGIASWEREALREALQGEIPYRRLRRLLTDAGLRRRTCLDAALTGALNDVFDPRAKEIASSRRKDLGKEFRTTRRVLERWERFMQRESISAPANNTEAPEDVLYREMLDRSQQRYLHLVRKARGTALQGEVIEWIARGLIADGEGRFARPTMRSNGEVLSPREAARRIRAVWKEVLAVASPRSLSGMGRLFRSTLEASGTEAFAMQDGFVSELLEALPGRPELAAEAETLEALYERIAGTADPETAIFARLQGQRLAARHENDNNE